MLGWLRNKWQRDLVTHRERREKAAQKHRDRKILCPRCGYDIKGMPDQPCSECGLFIESRWREGWFGAGSAGRRAAVLVLGIIGTYPVLMTLLVLLMSGGGYYSLAISMRLWEVDPLFWISDALWFTHVLVALGILAIAIVRYRPLVHGPKSLAIRVLVVCGVLYFGTIWMAQYVASVRAEGI